MATSMYINNNLSLPIFKNSCFKLSISCRARKVMMQSGKANFYQILSLDSKDVSQDEIKKAYRHKALEFHPDTCPHESSKEESTRRFIEIKLAYETLSDPVSRDRYDFEAGLVDSKERSYGSWCMDGSRREYCKETWEMQIQGLKERSQHRMERRRKYY